MKRRNRIAAAAVSTVGVFGVGAAALAAVPVEHSASGQSAKRRPASAPVNSRADAAELARLTAQLSTFANQATAFRTQVAQAEAELAKARALRSARAAQAAAQGAFTDRGAAGSQAGQNSQQSKAKSARPSDSTESDEGDDQAPAPGTTGLDDSSGDEGGTHD